MLIGHNPGLHELAMLLVATRATAARHDAPGGGPGGAPRRAIEHLAAGYPTGALAEFSIAGPWWQLDTGGGQLIRFLRPRDLRQDGPGDDGQADGGQADGGQAGAD